MIEQTDFVRFLSIKRGLEPESIRLCVIKLRKINEFLGGRNLDQNLTEEFFYKLKNEGLNNNTLNTYYFCFKQIEAYLKDRGKPSNFLEGFSAFAKVRPNINVLTLEEVEQIINTHKEYGRFQKFSAQEVTERLNFLNTTAIMFLAETGCRFEEVQKLIVKYVDLELGKVTLVDTKNKENRNVYIVGPLIERLKLLIKDKGMDDLVFTTLTGKQIHPTDFNLELKIRGELAGIPASKRVYAHLFRHSYATHLYIATKDIGLVQVVLGHKDIKSTQIYVHIADEVVKNGMMRHPRARTNSNPTTFLTLVGDAIAGYNIEQDHRFTYSLERTGDALNFRMQIKPEFSQNFFPKIMGDILGDYEI